jgi:hypothetical protein
MKKAILFLGFSVCLMGISFAQDAVPQMAKDHFASTYPGATNAKWDIEKDGIEVEFELNGVKWEGMYDATGNWKKTKRELKKDEVPQVVMDGLKSSEYGTWDADDPHEYQTPIHKSLYGFEIKKSGEKRKVFLTPEGMLVPEMTKTDN